MVKNLPANAGDVEMQIRSLGWEDPLEESMATHSSILAWRIPWTEEPGWLQSIGSHTVGHYWSDLACTHMIRHNHYFYLFPIIKNAVTSSWSIVFFKTIIFLKNFILIWLISSVSVSTVQQSESVIYIFFFRFLYWLLQNIEYSSLCYTVGLCYLFYV